MNMHGEKSKETGEELISLLTDLEDINERDAFGAAAVQAQNPVEKSSGALQRGSMSMGIVGRELPGSCRSFSSQGGLSQGVLMDDEDEDEEHLNTVDFCNARLQGRTHLSALSAATRGWPAPIRAIYHLYDAGTSWLVLAIVGISSGVVVSFVDIGADWATDMKFGYCNRGWWISRSVCCIDATDLAGCPEWKEWSSETLLAMIAYVCVGTTMAGLAAYITRIFAPLAGGSGIPEIKVILGGSNVKGFLGAKTLLIKAAGLVLSVGSGLSIGKEGPAIHVCTCIGNLWCRRFSKFKYNQNRKREVLSCAAGAGMAVAFGAPIGGVLFSLEEASSYFPPKTMWKAFFCAIVAVMTVQWLHRYPGNGKLVLFEVHYHHQWKFFEMPAFALLGAMGGLLGAAFIRINVFFTQLRRNTFVSDYPVHEVVLLCIASCLLNWHFFLLRGNTNGLLSALFSECGSDAVHVRTAMCHTGNSSVWSTASTLLTAAGVKFALTACTATAAVPGGTLVPSLAIGGLIGRAVGLGMESLQRHYGEVGIFAVCGRTTQCITPGVYAMVGAASLLGGVTRMTVSLVVIMFELTGGLEYMLPIMVAVMVSKWVGDACGKESMYDLMVAVKGYPYLDTKAEVCHTVLKAEDVMTACPLDAVPLSGNTSISIGALLQCSGHKGFPVVTTMSEMFVVGYISRRSLLRLRKEATESNARIDLSTCMDTSPLQISPTTPLDRIWEMFSLLGLSYLVVSFRGRLAGIIKKKDLFAFQREIRNGVDSRHGLSKRAIWTANPDR